METARFRGNDTLRRFRRSCQVLGSDFWTAPHHRYTAIMVCSTQGRRNDEFSRSKGRGKTDVWQPGSSRFARGGKAAGPDRQGCESRRAAGVKVRLMRSSLILSGAGGEGSV